MSLTHLTDRAINGLPGFAQFRDLPPRERVLHVLAALDLIERTFGGPGGVVARAQHPGPDWDQMLELVRGARRGIELELQALDGIRN